MNKLFLERIRSICKGAGMATFVTVLLFTLGEVPLHAGPNTNIYVHFENSGCETVKVYWENGSQHVHYQTLAAGEYYTQHTYVGHHWVFKLTNGTVVGNYTANYSNTSYHINSGGCGSNEGDDDDDDDDDDNDGDDDNDDDDDNDGDDNDGDDDDGDDDDDSDDIGDCTDIPNDIDGFIYLGEFDNSKYYCSNTNNFEWEEAVAATEANGGFLAVINSQEENAFLAEHILATAWIGYTDEASEGTFVWVNGEATTYTNWSSGEPNNQGVNGGHADYTVMKPNDGKWRDRNGHDHYEFIMEIPCPTPPDNGEEVCVDEVIAFWDLEACYANSGNGSNSDYSEFTAAVNQVNCTEITASTASRHQGNHSCTPGQEGKAMCIGTQASCGPP